MTIHLISALLGPDIFEILLATLPDHFYRLSRPDQEIAWSAILSAINRGETDIDNLAAIPSNLQVTRLETFA